MNKMSLAVDYLSKQILTLQHNGDYQGVDDLVASKGIISNTLRANLDRLQTANIPVDIVFKQGKKVLGL